MDAATVPVLGKTPMVEPPAMLDVGLCSAAIPDTAVPKDIMKVTFVANETTCGPSLPRRRCQLRGRFDEVCQPGAHAPRVSVIDCDGIRWNFSSTECTLALRAHPLLEIEVCES